jgi:hypothetical protein
MVVCPNNYFPPPAPPRAGQAAGQITGAANPGLHPGLSKFRPSWPFQIEKMVTVLLAIIPISIILNKGSK